MNTDADVYEEISDASTTLREYVDSLNIKEVYMTSADVSTSFNCLHKFIVEQALEPNIAGIKFKHRIQIPGKDSAPLELYTRIHWLKSLLPALDVLSDLHIYQGDDLLLHKIINPPLKEVEDNGYISALCSYRVIEVYDVDPSQPLLISFTAYILDISERKHITKFCPLY